MKQNKNWDPNFYSRSTAFEGLSVPIDYLTGTDFPGLASMSFQAAKAGVTNFSGYPLVFVAQPPKGRRRKVASALVPGYEARISQFGEVQTRLQNWHDFFNHLVWLNFPKSKATHMQKQHLQRTRTDDVALTAWRSGRRTKEQDALALFDEGGVLLVCDASIYEAVVSKLKAMRFDQCNGNISFSEIGPVYFRVFGHAIFEEFIHRSKDAVVDIGALTIVVPVDLRHDQGPSNRMIDESLSQILASEETLVTPSNYSTVSVGTVFPWKD